MLYQLKDKSSAHNFQNALKEGNIIVLYYADWCGYCQQFKPVWEELKKRLSKQSKPICHIGEVESANMQHLPDVEVRSYPTIQFYKKKGSKSIKSKKPHLDTRQDAIPKVKPANTFQEFVQNIMKTKPQDKPQDKHIVPFEGEDRTIANLLKFIRKQADGKSITKKPKMVNLSTKIAMTKLSKTLPVKKNNKVGKDTKKKGEKTKKNINTLVTNNVSKTKKRKSGRKSKKSTTNNTQTLQDYKNAKKSDKDVGKDIMNSFKNEL